MKVSLACLLLLLNGVYCRSQQNPSGEMALESSTSLAPLTAMVRVVRSVTEVNLVLTITRGKHLVDNLKPQDLRILDDGQPPARVTYFESKTNLPIRLALLIDKSDSVRGRFKLEQSSAADFLKRVLRPGDLAMIVGFNKRVELAQGLTGDQSLLSRGIKSLKPGGDTALYDAVSFAARKLADTKETGPVRRIIVVLSDGQENSSRRHLEKTINDALYSETAIFSITSSEEVICRGDPVCEEGENTLKSLSDSTGGEFLRAAAESDLASSFRKIGDELRKQYAVAYRPASNAPDGRFHIVTVSSRNGTRVHCRKGYYAKTVSPQ